MVNSRGRKVRASDTSYISAILAKTRGFEIGVYISLKVVPIKIQPKYAITL